MNICIMFLGEFQNLFLKFYSKDEQSGDITFYMKGADVVMQNHVNYNDWLEEEVYTLTSF